MATFTFFDEWKNLQATVVNASTDTFKIMLTSDTPVTATDSIKADLTEISATGGYASKTPTMTWAETGAGTGIWRLSIGADQTWTAVGAPFDTFRYAVLYDDTVASPVKPLVGFWDYGSNLTMASAGDSFTLNVDANFAVYTLT